MTQANDDASRRDIIVEPQRTPAVIAQGGRGLSRPPLPRTRKLEDPKDIIAVDVSERMDQAAAIEAADQTSESLLFKAIRTAIVVFTGAMAWWLLPHESPPRPPITLPDALQSNDVSATPKELTAENDAIETLRNGDRYSTVARLQACIDSGHATHRAWRSYLTVLQQLDRNKELLEQALAYEKAHPDRLEAAHFVTEGRLRQGIDSQRTGLLGYVSDDFKEVLAQAQEKLSKAIELLDQHEADWSHKTRRAWRDALLLDKARLYERQWLCEETPFEHEFRDNALAALSELTEKDADNALQLKLSIYRRIAHEWPWYRKKGTRLYENEEECPYAVLQKAIKDLTAKLKNKPAGDHP